jgi:CubicO group peptidase (beta-lactamase class C family)
MFELWRSKIAVTLHRTAMSRPLGIILVFSAALLLSSAPRAQEARPSSAAPQAASQPKTAAPNPGRQELTAVDLGAFLDGLIPMQLQREDIAGAVIAVVKDGQLLFAKGYGYSDAAKKTPVTPESTLFRPGSISKLFTWTAVMQQVERGKLELDRDVNSYLDFKIPATYPQAITLRHLMTHTPGFEETQKNLIQQDVRHLEPLGLYLGSHVPRRIFPPGLIPAYSNYGAALAGYIVERVSGQPFNQYVDEQIFKPLGMAHSSFAQPLPDSLKPLMSSGYRVASEPAQPFEVIEDAPAGALSTAASDLAHFMIAHLQDGRFNGATILRPETARLMHSRQLGPHPALNGMALGFYEQNRNGHRIISHGGDTVYFHSDLYLIPDVQVGLFMSYNSAGKGEIDPREAVFEKFMDRFFPDPAPPEATLATAARDAKSVTGLYLCSRRSETTILSVVSAVNQLKVSANSDGTISADWLRTYSGQAKHLREVGPLLFREVNGSDRVAFTRDASGHLVLAVDFPGFIFQRVPWYKSAYLNRGVFYGSFGVFGLALLFWPFGAAIRWHYGRKLDLSTPERRVRLSTRLVCLVNLAFLLAWTAYGSLAEKNLSLISDSFDPWMRVMELLGLIGVFGTVVALYNCVKAWRNPNRWLWSKVGETLIALACLSLTWFVFQWHMLAWSLNY